MNANLLMDVGAWPEAAVAIAGTLLVGVVVVGTVWQGFATLRERIAARNSVYRERAEQAAAAEAETAARLEQAQAELRRLREQAERRG